MSRPFSVILLPTLHCNVACDYCFEDKSKQTLTLEQLPRLTELLLDHMVERGSKSAQIYWQGGEVMTVGPDWFEKAYALMGEAAQARGLSLRHYVQTNLIGWSARWHSVVKTMFEGSLGTSMDYPNRHRRLKNGSTEKYTELWLAAVRDAQAAGLQVGVIAVLHAATMEVSPSEFYEFFVRQAGITDFQVNMPFPGGPGEHGNTLESGPLARFMTGLMDVWMERGRHDNVRIGPFDELISTFAGRPASLPCIWQQNCADEFVSIDARGNAALCDCWVTSYPEYSFGNVFKAKGLGDMLGGSEARKRFLARPEKLMRDEECGTCEWLSMCHGGCPIRTFADKGTIYAKDPYCEVYKAIFSHAREWGRKSRTRPLASVK